MEIEHTATIHAPAAIVWGLTIDIERWPGIMPTVTRVEMIGPRPIHHSSQAWLEQPGSKPAIWTVTEFEPMRRFAWSSTLMGARVTGSHTIVPTAAGCENRLTLTLEGWRGRLIDALFGGRLLTTLMIENESFRAAAEDVAWPEWGPASPWRPGAPEVAA